RPVVTKRKIANSVRISDLIFAWVVPPGIEPGTQGFSVINLRVNMLLIITVFNVLFYPVG
ncbi:hypothetical protein, partial [uncultured Muribaculum sp.]|uniref:hypothetical protein n=1 Tax=uncultured Muribaculum sp. TaxID=1918613 RepID=UPI00272B50C8